MKMRRVVSLTVLLSFVLLSVTGILLFLSPEGRVAYWSHWTLLGMTKTQMSQIHTTVMVLFLVGGVWHIVLNWKPILGYLKNRSRQIRPLTPEMGVAAVLTALFTAGPLLGLFPFQQFLDAGAGVKDHWEATQGAPPWGHAEENTLARFCRGMEDYERLEHQRLVAVDCDAALAAIRDQGMEVEGTNQKLLDIAEANGTTPQALGAIVMTVARELTPAEAAARLQPEVPTDRFQKPYSGLGRMTLASYAEEYGYDLAEMRAILAKAGWTVDPSATLREEATRLGTDPEGIVAALNGEGSTT